MATRPAVKFRLFLFEMESGFMMGAMPLNNIYSLLTSNYSSLTEQNNKLIKSLTCRLLKNAIINKHDSAEPRKSDATNFGYSWL